MKNVLRHFADGLSKRHNLLVLDPIDVRRRSFWSALDSFRPEILHYLAGPTITSLILLRYLRVRTSAKTAVTAIHPWFPLRTDLAVGAFLPDLVLSASRRTEAMFSKYRVRTAFQPFGVDTARFIPADLTRKADWRREFGISVGRYLILHVGHIVPRRGIEDLARLQSLSRQVLVVGSVGTEADVRLRRRLESQGVMVWTRYLADIEKIYALADCYIFPTRDPLGAIEIPLSVLEAMSCNLPVVAFPFGGLPDLFPADAGVTYEERPERWAGRIDSLAGVSGRENRSKVLPLDWNTVTASLEEHYRRLLEPPAG
jgi:glycosyltransferase involved in cell wall biosynthesis